MEYPSAKILVFIPATDCNVFSLYNKLGMYGNFVLQRIQNLFRYLINIREFICLKLRAMRLPLRVVE